MNLLDMRTVLFSYVISNAICAAVLASLWWQNRRRSPELGFWLADFSLQFLALVLMFLRSLLPDLLTMVISNTLVMGGTLLLFIGLERYTRKTSRQWFNYLYLAGFIFVQAYFVFLQPSLQARNINVSLGLLVMCSQCAWLLLRRVDASMRLHTRPAGLIFVAFSLVSFTRIFIDLAVPPVNDLFKSGLYDTLMILTYQMLYISLTFTLFLMVNRRLFSELDNDIRERKMAEEALRKSEEKFSTAFQNIPDALLITAIADGKIIEANESFFQMSGFSKEESLGRTTIDLNLWGSLADRGQLVETLQKMGQVRNFETDFRKKSGELFSGSISSELIHLQGQACVLNIIRDLSGQKLADREIQRLSRFPAENPNPVLRISQTGRILYANLSSAPLLAAWGREVEQDLPDDWCRQIAAVFESGKSKVVEMDCEGRIFSCTLTPIIDEGYVNFYGLDITERILTEDALREANDYLENLFNYANAPIIVWDARFRITRFNHAFEILTGRSATDVLGKALQILFPPEQEKASLELIRKTLSGERWEVVEIDIQHADGSICTVLWNSATLFSADGKKPIATIAQGQDITARKKAEDMLRKRLELLEFSATHSLDEVLQKTLDEVGELTDSPIGFYHFVDRDQENLTLQTWSTRTLQEFCKAEGKGLHYPVSQAGIWADCVQTKLPILHNDYASETGRKGLPEGHAEVVRELVVPILRSGQVVAILGIGNKAAVYTQEDVDLVSYFADIAWESAERKQADEILQSYSEQLETQVEQRSRELRAAQEKLLRQERLAMLGQLAGSIGHELRNPLSVMSNALFFLTHSTPEAGEKVKEYYQILENEVRNADKIITDLLDFARIKAMDRQAVAVAGLVQQTLERFPAPEAVRLQLEIPPDLPPVLADGRQMVQVLGNLVTNAYQAMPKGGQLTVGGQQVSGSPKPGQWIMISVRDTGTGIPTENMEKLFEPLFTTKPRGIGLGLPVCQKLAEANGGWIEVQSQPGAGSTFRLYLPSQEVLHG